jgi:hypothetical protein
MPQIIVNGKSYASLEDMPADVRQAYEQMLAVMGDQNLDGTPDMGAGVGKTVTSKVILSGPIQSTTLNFNVDGKSYSSLAEMPVDVRAKYELAMGSLGQVMRDADGNGVPDIMEGKEPVLSWTTQSTPVTVMTKKPPEAQPYFGAAPVDNTAQQISSLSLAERLLIIFLVIFVLAVGVFIILRLVK